MVLEVKNIKKSFQGNIVLSDISFGLDSGEVMAVVGPSGAGKTTLLRCINALETSDGGSIKVDDKYLYREEKGKMIYADKKEMKDIRKKLGMVFQNFNLFPHKTVLENIIESPVNVYGVSKEEAIAEAGKLLQMLELTEKAEAYPHQMSGGQRQRAAIARACALRPSIMCFDEPTSALDPELTEGIAAIIEKLAGQGMSILVITHDMGFAKRIADRIIFMEGGQIVHSGTKDEFFEGSDNERVKRFIQS
ncbi:MAG: Phosphonate-transporting ATPase [Clostridia bacterium]|nr:Phosphonate-transporting ATPase [Clostridia bacterium]